MADIQQLYAGRVEAASIALARGDRSEAERLYTEALTMGEEHFGRTSAQLAAPLNELSRLYVHLSAHARAEPLLLRLLHIRRADGDNHPGVAPVLAALASVRRAIGDDAAAENLYRRALAIREVAHAPDHMAVVVTLEQLGDTCAARGKFTEAIALFDRALPVREAALGPEHATVRGLRARMAEITLQVSPRGPEAPLLQPAPTPPAPVTSPASFDAPASNQLVFIYEPEKPVRRASVRRGRSATPPFSSMAVAAASMIAAPAHVAVASQPAIATQVAAPSLVPSAPFEFDAPAAPRDDPARAERDGVTQPWQRRESLRSEALTPAPESNIRRYAYSAAGMTALVGALFIANARMSNQRAASPVASVQTRQPTALAPAPAPLPVASVGAMAASALARPDSTRIASAEPAKIAPASTPLQPAPEPVKRVATPGLPDVLPTIGAFAVPVTTPVNADSVIRESTTGRDVHSDLALPTTTRLRTPAVTDERAETPPVLMGSAPQPRFPDALRGRAEGAVVVQFLVGADGRVDASSMKVVRSPHELFTSAVRAVLPRFRFEPARAADATPKAEWVRYSIEFRAAK